MFKFLSGNVKKAAVFALALAMVSGVAFAVPGQAQAANEEPKNAVVVDKTATLEDDGTYTINLEAYATGETTVTSKQEPTDIVLVLDASQSMDNTISTGTGYGYAKWSGKAKNADGKYHKHSDNTYHKAEIRESGFISKKYTLTCKDCGTKIFEGKEGDDQIGTSYGLYEYKSSTSQIQKLVALKNAVNSFIAGVQTNSPDDLHKIAVVSYNKSSTIQYQLTSVNKTSAGKIEDTVDGLKTDYYTRTDLGMQNAYDVLKNNLKDGRKKVVIVFTDGVPTDNSSQNFNKTTADNAIATAHTLKDAGVTVYTIGILDGADPADLTKDANRFLNGLSSNYPNASASDSNKLGSRASSEYYKVAKDADELMSIFKEIQETSTSTTVKLDERSILKDIIAEGFDASAAVVKAWKVPNAGLNTNNVRQWNQDTKTHVSLDDKCIINNNGTISVNGYKYNEEYVREENGSPMGSKLVVTITGVVPTDNVKLNEQVDTNDPKSGIYENPDSKDPVKTFPEPKTILTDALYVVDYAKSFDMAAADWKQDLGSTLYGSFRKADAAPAYGRLAGMEYTPVTTNWNGFDTFYAFGKTGDETIKEASANANGNLWSKVSVLPANNVYYEDEFETDETGVVGIVYDGNWEVVGDKGKNREQANTPIHGGWENTDLADDAGDSNGSSHLSSNKEEEYSTASFEFYGTGVDVYTRTDRSTDTITAILYKQEEDTWKSVKLSFICNYAEDSEQGAYYQIPTLSYENLDPGHYKVVIYVDGESGNYYLDGIRVYNPLKDQENNAVVQRAYGDELTTAFVEVRDKLIEAGTFNGGSSAVNGFVLIDKILPSDTENFDKLKEVDETEDSGEPEEEEEEEEETAKNGVAIYEMALYKNYGPKNEVYLAPGQGIAFAVDPAGKYSIGLKAPKGATKVEITRNGDISGIDIKHSTDLYYPVSPTKKGLVIVKNTGEKLLAVTKLKFVAGVNAASEPALASSALGDLLEYANMFDTLSMVPYQAEAEEPETPEVTEPEPEVTPGVDIVVPEPAAPAQPTTGNRFAQMLKSILNALRRSK